MIFSERIKLEKEYEEWVASGSKELTPVSIYDSKLSTFLIFLEEKGLLADGVLYLCDQKECKNCTYPECRHTSHVEHAKNFNKAEYDTPDGHWFHKTFWEKEDDSDA